MAEITCADLKLSWSFCITIWGSNNIEIRFFEWIKVSGPSYSKNSQIAKWGPVVGKKV